MRLLDYLLLALATAAGLAAAGGGIMLTLPSPKYRPVITAFRFAALCFGGLGIVWGIQASNYSLSIRLLVAGLTAAIAAMAATYVVSLVEHSAKDANAPNFEFSEFGFYAENRTPDAYRIKVILKNRHEHSASDFQWILVAAPLSLNAPPVLPVERKEPLSTDLVQNQIISIVTEAVRIVGNVKPLLIYLGLSYKDAITQQNIIQELTMKWEGVNAETGLFWAPFSGVGKSESSKMLEYLDQRKLRIHSPPAPHLALDPSDVGMDYKIEALLGTLNVEFWIKNLGFAPAHNIHVTVGSAPRNRLGDFIRIFDAAVPQVILQGNRVMQKSTAIESFSNGQIISKDYTPDMLFGVLVLYTDSSGHKFSDDFYFWCCRNRSAQQVSFNERDSFLDHTRSVLRGAP
jgi:hypothetical protein